MPSLERNSNRIVIAGASSLLGVELISLLEESRFAGWDLRLVDEDLAAGTLVEAAGEPAVIQPVDDDTFRGARFGFLASSPEFAKRCIGPAHNAGAVVIDLSGAAFSDSTFGDSGAAAWFPRIESLTGKQISKELKSYAVLSAAGAGIAGLALALSKYGLSRLVGVVNQSVSEAGRAGIEELEAQAARLLTFQSIGHEIFGVQTAFNTTPRYGAASKVDLSRSGKRIQEQVLSLLPEAERENISILAVHAPVFYGTTFSICADLEQRIVPEDIVARCREAGLVIVENDQAGPGNVSVAGEENIYFAVPRQDENRPGTWWFWGAADNFRVPAASAIKLAEKLTS